MYRVKSFKWNEKDPEAKVVYTIVRQEGDERHVLECSDPPKPELLAALQGLEQDALRECEVVKLDAPDIPGQVAIRSVSFSWALDIMGASICLLVALDHSDQPLVLNTPHKPSQPYSEAGGHTLPPALVKKLEDLHVLIERYIDGDRVKKQTDLFDDEEEGCREPPDADCSVSLNGGPAIPLEIIQSSIEDAHEGSGGCRMTAPRITAEEIAEYRQIAIAPVEVGGMPWLHKLLDALESAWAANRILDDAAKDAQAFAYQAQEARAECDRLRAELDRLSAHGGEVPRLNREILAGLLSYSPGDGSLHLPDSAYNINKWIHANYRPAPPHPDTVEVSREDYEYLQLCEAVATTKPRAGGEDFALRWNSWVNAHNLMWELVAKRDALRAKAQPATEREDAHA